MPMGADFHYSGLESSTLSKSTRLSESVSCLPAGRCDLWACILPSSVKLMSGYHSFTSCSSFSFSPSPPSCIQFPSRDLSSPSRSAVPVRELAVRKELFSTAVKFPPLSGSVCVNRLGNIAARQGSWLGLLPVA